MATPLEISNQLSTNASTEAYNPSVNAVLTTISSNFATATGYTNPTFFLANANDINKLVAISVQECSAGGVAAAPLGGFTLDLFRSIDGGFSYQLFATYTTVQELVVPNMALFNVLYRFQLRVKGTNSLRVRALGIN